MIRRFGLLGVFLLLPASLLWAASVTGNWRVTISTHDGQINGVASLKENSGAVTGWVGPSESDPIPISGVLKGNKLTIETHPQPGRTVAFAKCELTVEGNRMAGTIDTDQGTIEFVKSESSNGPR